MKDKSIRLCNIMLNQAGHKAFVVKDVKVYSHCDNNKK